MSIDTHYQLETTEHVELDFELAGPGSRFCAWAIDALLMFLIAFLLAVVGMVTFGAVGTVLDGDLERALGGWALTAAIMAFFLVTTFYHVFFEIVLRGQTPGKRQLQLRAIREDGVGMGVTDILIRNLLRVVDFLPLFYGLGGAISLFHPMHKRLGDLAAGTIVVKEGELDYRAHLDSRRDAVPQPETLQAAGQHLTLASDERQVIERFLARRNQLTLAARQALADRLARSMYDRHTGYWGSAESYLERLLQGKHDEP